MNIRMTNAEIQIAPAGTPLSEMMKARQASKAQAIEQWASTLGISLEEWQRRTLQHYFGTTESEYIKTRLNTRLQGEDPGPYERDPLHR